MSDTASSLLRTGGIFDGNVLNDERSRIASFLKNRGYYNFSINNIEYVADSTAGDRPRGSRSLRRIEYTACAISMSFRDTTRRRR